MNFLVPAMELQADCFQGPLPALLHLIKKNKVNVFDIPVGMIAQRFLDYLELVKEMNMRIAEDFIELASLLIFIKARMLLPREDDPREELIERILEYEKTRAMARELEVLPQLGRDVFARGKVVVEDEAEELHLASLCLMFFKLIKDREERYIEVREIRPTLEEKLIYIKEILAQKGSFAWKAQSEENHSERVASVLAMLELTKLRLAKVSQRRIFGTILLTKR
jgi:segregation and condensation protein A